MLRLSVLIEKKPAWGLGQLNARQKLNVVTELNLYPVRRMHCKPTFIPEDCFRDLPEIIVFAATNNRDNEALVNPTKIYRTRIKVSLQ